MIRTDATNKRLRDEIQYRRKEVMDLLGGKCEVCSMSNEHILEIHHVLPLSEGGGNNWDNLSILCPSCHRSVHHLTQTNNPSEVLSDYVEQHILCLPKFISVVMRNVEALKKQNNIRKNVLNRKISLLNEKISNSSDVYD